MCAGNLSADSIVFITDFMDLHHYIWNVRFPAIYPWQKPHFYLTTRFFALNRSTVVLGSSWSDAFVLRYKTIQFTCHTAWAFPVGFITAVLRVPTIGCTGAMPLCVGVCMMCENLISVRNILRSLEYADVCTNWFHWLLLWYDVVNKILVEFRCIGPEHRVK